VGAGSQMLCFIAAAVFTGAGDAGLTRLILPMQPDYTGYDSMTMIPGGVAGIWPRIEHGSHRYFRYGFDFPALERRDDIGLLLLSSPSNPTGRCADAAELASLTKIAERRDVPLIVDHAYGEPFPKIGQTLVPPAWHPNVINCFSLSKAGLPGERIGIAIGPERYISAMVSFLSNACVCSSRLAQAAVAAGLRSGRLDELVCSVITPFYAGRRTMGESLLHQFMPGDVNWRVHTSRGGMFCWVWVDEDWFDDLRLYRLLKTRHVFITPGRSFFVEPESQSDLGSHARRCVRISLTTDEATLVEGMKRIGDAVSELRAISDTTRRD
jgi:valine--pyruvate aminotransferase